MIERRLVIVRRRHRFHLELNGFESGYAKRFGKPDLRVIVAGRVLSAHEMNRPAHDSGANLYAKLASGLLAQIFENPRDQILQSGAPAEYFRTFQGSTRQKRFQRLNQAALILGQQIVFDTFRASPRLHGFPAQFSNLLQVEQRSVIILHIATEGNRRSSTSPEWCAPGYGTIGSSKIDPKVNPDIHFWNLTMPLNSSSEL